MNRVDKFLKKLETLKPGYKNNSLKRKNKRRNRNRRNLLITLLLTIIATVTSYVYKEVLKDKEKNKKKLSSKSNNESSEEPDWVEPIADRHARIYQAIVDDYDRIYDETRH